MSDPSRFLSKAAAASSAGGGGLAKKWGEVLALCGQPGPLCGQPGVTNLGQGAPNFMGSEVAVAAARDALESSVALNQYSPVPGIPSLIQAIQCYYGRKHHQQLKASEILVTTSGTEALDVACKTLFGPGDKMIILNPSFPWYVPVVQHTGAEPLIIDLEAPAFEIPFHLIEEELARGGVRASSLTLCRACSSGPSTCSQRPML